MFGVLVRCMCAGSTIVRARMMRVGKALLSDKGTYLLWLPLTWLAMMAAGVRERRELPGWVATRTSVSAMVTAVVGSRNVHRRELCCNILWASIVMDGDCVVVWS